MPEKMIDKINIFLNIFFYFLEYKKHFNDGNFYISYKSPFDFNKQEYIQKSLSIFTEETYKNVKQDIEFYIKNNKTFCVIITNNFKIEYNEDFD